MREVKNDIRYILKRVIIGVLTTIILFNVSKCNVYAETVKHLTLNTKRNDTVLSFSDDSIDNSRNLGEVKLYNNAYTLKLDTIYNDTTYYNVFYNSENNDYFVHFFTPKEEQINTINNSKGLVIRYTKAGTDKNPIYYYDPVNIFSLSSDNEIIDGFEFSNLSKTVLGSSSFSNGVVNRIYIENGKLKKEHISSQLSYGKYITEDYDLIYSSFNKDIYYYNAYKSSFVFKKYSSFPPNGYSELDLTGYQGVFFTAKDYDNIEVSEIGDLYTTTFDYYYQNDIKEAYFPLDNHFDIRYNSGILNAENPTLKNTYFPLKRKENDGSFTYYALMVYNNTDIGNVLEPNTYGPYGPAKVWYNSNLYNYHLVKDFNSFSENVSFGAGGKENNIKVEGLPTLKDAIDDAKMDDLINSFNPQSNNVIFEFLKTPFTFLRNLSPDKCQSFSLTIPFVNYALNVSCLSSTFKDVLGNNYNIIALLVNAYFIYYLTLKNIQVFKDSLDPENDKLEVVEL